MRTVSPVIDPTRLDTSAAYNLGSLAEAYNSTYKQWCQYVYVKNGGANAWAIGSLVGKRDGVTSYDCDVVPTSAPAMRVAGIAQGYGAAGTTTFTAGSYGWVLREGWAEVLADTGGIAANTAILPGNAVAGAADNVAAVTDHALGFSSETVLATALATCWVCCQG